jgi:hypothetical protein
VVGPLAYRAPPFMDFKDILDMLSGGYVYLLLLSVEHSEGKGRESDVAILRFLCGSTHPCRLGTAPFWP